MINSDDVVCICGPMCDPFREDAYGVFDCSFCGADWGGDTGLEPWHQGWCVHAIEGLLRGL